MAYLVYRENERTYELVPPIFLWSLVKNVGKSI